MHKFITGWMVLLLAGCFGGGNSNQGPSSDDASQRPGQIANPPIVQTEAADADSRAPSVVNSPVASNASPALPEHPELFVAPEINAAFSAYRRGAVQTPEFVNSLRAAAPKLPLVDVTTGDGALTWNSLTINALGLGFDAIRFRSPLTQPADMHWVFSMPSKWGSWYIVPVQGTITGFASYEADSNLDFIGANLLPGNITVFQAMTGGQILPGQEYILWFAELTEPVSLRAAIRLSPAGSHGSDVSRDAIIRALQLEPRYHQFAPDQHGLAEAYTVLHKMRLRGDHKSGGFLAALRSVASGLPEVKESADGKVIWNTIDASTSLQFAAVRFRLPPSIAATLNWMFVTDGDFLSWGILPADAGEMIPADYHVRFNVPPGGVDLPKDNLSVFQAIEGIEADREYIAWFTPLEGVLPEVLQVAFRASPAVAGEFSASAQDIAARCGWDISDSATPEQSATLLRRCRALWDRDQQNTAEMMRLLRGALADLPRASMSTNGVEWNTVALDGDVGCSALVIEPSGSVPSALAIVTAKPAMPRAYWIVLNPALQNAPTASRYPAENMVFEGLDGNAFPVVVFDIIDPVELLAGGPQILFFATDGNSPLTAQVAARWLPSELDTTSIPTSPRTAADALGLKIGVEPAMAGSRIMASHLMTSQAMQFAHSGSRVVSGNSDGALQLWDPQSGESLELPPSNAGDIHDLDISGDGRFCAAAHTETQHVSVWDLKTRTLKHSLNWVNARPQRVCLSFDARWLAAWDAGLEDGNAVRQGTVAVWDLQNPDRPRTIPAEQNILYAAEFNRTGDVLFVAGFRYQADARNATGIVNVLQMRKPADLTLQKEIVENDTASNWYDLALSSDGTRLYGSHVWGELEIRDAATGERLAATAQPGLLSKISVAPDGSRFATLSGDRVLRLWDAQSLQLRRMIAQPAHEISAAVFGSDGGTIFTAGNDGTLRSWDCQRTASPIAGTFSEKNEANSIGMTMVAIPPGEFEMGFAEKDDPQNAVPDEHPQHHVRITRAFFMSAHEVTVGQFRQFVGETGYQTTAEASGLGGSRNVSPSELWNYVNSGDLTWRCPGFEQTDEHPVLQVSWEDAGVFCKWLSAKENTVYRLPTEAEWEYACRAGSPYGWSWGNNITLAAVCCNGPDQSLVASIPGTPSAANWNDGFPMSAPVGSFLPNAFGLFDLQGNIWEYCSDWYDAAYFNYSPTVDPPGPKSGQNRVVRGSSYLHFVNLSQSSRRNNAAPTQATWDQGFRVVRESP